MPTQERRPTPNDIPPQKLDYPASQRDMIPQPDSDLSNYNPANKLTDKVAFITGGDSGIGRAVAIAYALEGVEKVDNYDTDGIMKRAAQPEELAPAYVFLASSDSAFVMGAL